MGVWLPSSLLFVALYQPLSRQEMQVGRPIPIAVRAGHCEFVLPTARARQSYCLVLGALARGGGPYHVRVQTTAATGPALIEREGAAGAAPNGMADSPEHGTLPANYPVRDDPPAQREFDLFTGAGSFRQPQGYVTVHAQLRAVGRHCLVYADRDGPQPATAAIEDARHTFDADVYPRACQELGCAWDIDRDGRFVILFTPWLSRLDAGRVHLSGCVHGSDFLRDLPAPYGNRCDMLYLNSELAAGPFLRTVLAHEYAHAVVFSEHVLARAGGAEEEAWVNEGIAHLVEERHAYGWDNLDYRVSAFLNDPARYALVVPDYFAAGLYRSHGHRGATYLFLHWCAHHARPGLTRRLAASSATGVANVELATGETFAELFRGWTTWLALGADKRLQGPFGERLLSGVHVDELGAENETFMGDVAATAARYVMVRAKPGGPAWTRVVVEAESAADLQVTVLPLPVTGQLHVRHEVHKRGTLQLVVAAEGSSVSIENAAWERLVPTERRTEDTSYRPWVAVAPGRDWFDRTSIPAGTEVRSRAIAGPATPGRWVVKVRGRDLDGHRVTGWHVVDIEKEPGRAKWF